jgi:DNA polymerase-3 subunit chi
MARVDFYVLSQAGVEARFAFACRLAEKAYRLENSVYVHAASKADAARLDDLLWTFRDGSFVPHGVIGEAAAEEAPVRIGYGDTRPPDSDLLINLCDDVPAIAESFPRVAELVTSDDESRSLSRRRFANYRDGGHEIDTHNL